GLDARAGGSLRGRHHRAAGAARPPLSFKHSGLRAGGGHGGHAGARRLRAPGRRLDPAVREGGVMTMEYLEKSVAITGIGQSEIGRPSSKSAMRLTIDAALEAIADAGLTRDDIDGAAGWPGDNNNGDGFSPVGPSALISALGLKVNWYGAGYEGPGPLAGVI